MAAPEFEDPFPGDPFFSLLGGGECNAFIGVQGEEDNPIDGYIDAALELSGAILAKKLYGKRDTLVLPILYNARRSVELTFKFVIELLHDAGVLMHERPRDDDIADHYAKLTDTRLPDERMRELVSELKPYIESLSTIDDDGQMLR